MWALLALFLFQAPDFSAEGTKALDEGRYEAAARAFTQAIEADPSDYTAHFNLALAQGFLHRDAEGIAEYRKVLELQPGLYEAQLNLGILLLRQKNPADALPLLTAAAAQKPAEFRPRYYLAEAQLASGTAGEAAASFQTALQADPKSAQAELGLARALAKLGKLNDAAPHFRRAAQLDARYQEALLELAGLYEKNRQNEEAAALYRELPENAAAQERLGEMLLENKNSGEAVAALETAYKKSPTPAARLALAIAYVSNRELEKALPLVAKAASEDPGNYDTVMLYGRVLRDSRQYGAAAAQFAAALKLKPGESKAWSELGSMLYMQGEYPQGLAAFERARELGGDTPGNWFLRAIMLDKLKQRQPALEAYEHFLAISQGKNPDQEFQARQRARILKREIEKR